MSVWPENWRAWCLFLEFQTQWRTAGMTGVRVGLEYLPLMQRLDRVARNADDWEDLFTDVRVMEIAALDQMAEQAAST